MKWLIDYVCHLWRMAGGNYSDEDYVRWGSYFWLPVGEEPVAAINAKMFYNLLVKSIVMSAIQGKPLPPRTEEIDNLFMRASGFVVDYADHQNLWVIPHPHWWWCGSLLARDFRLARDAWEYCRITEVDWYKGATDAPAVRG